MRGMILTLMVSAGLTTPALARDSAAYQAIAAGDLHAAEQRLEAERRIFPQRPEVLLNLAAVYMRKGRTAEARALYVAVQARPAAMMDMPGGATRTSHEIASRGLDRLAPMLATR